MTISNSSTERLLILLCLACGIAAVMFASARGETYLAPSETVAEQAKADDLWQNVPSATKPGPPSRGTLTAAAPAGGTSIDERLDRVQAAVDALRPQIEALVEAKRRAQAQSLSNSLLESSNQPARQTVAINWLTSPEAGWRESKTTGKPALIYWTGPNCAPCRTFEAKVIQDPEVQRILSEQFVCVKLDAEAWSRDPELRERLRKYRVRAMPTVNIIEPTWETSTVLKRTNDPSEFAELLTGQVKSTAARTLNVRYATYQTPLEDEGEYAAAESEPLPNWTPRATTRYTSGGSSGGYGGRSPYASERIVYVQSAPTAYYGTAGSSGGYGGYSAGSSGGFGGTAGSSGGFGGGYSGYYSQPAYQPAYYSSGPSMICVGGTCYLQ